MDWTMLREAMERLAAARKERDAEFAKPDWKQNISARMADDEYWAAREALVNAVEQEATRD